MEPQRLAINQITTPRWSLAEAAQGYARQGVGGIGVWRDKLAECGLQQARRLLRDTGLRVPSLCKAGDLARLDAQGPHAALEDCRRAIDEARSEEHTSELQSPMRISYAVFCLKTKTNNSTQKSTLK